MKSLLLIAISTVGLIPLQASELLLSQTRNNGSATDPYAFDRSCEIFDDKIETHIQVGASSITKSVTVKTTGIKALIEAAVAGAVVPSAGQPGSAITYQAILNKPGEPAKIVTLRKSGPQIEVNQADEAKMLTQLLDQACN